MWETCCTNSCNAKFFLSLNGPWSKQHLNKHITFQGNLFVPSFEKCYFYFIGAHSKQGSIWITGTSLTLFRTKPGTDLGVPFSKPIHLLRIFHCTKKHERNQEYTNRVYLNHFEFEVLNNLKAIVKARPFYMKIIFIFVQEQ